MLIVTPGDDPDGTNIQASPLLAVYWVNVSPETIQTNPWGMDAVTGPDDDMIRLSAPDADKPVLTAVNDVATLPVIVSGDAPFTVLTEAVKLVPLTVIPDPFKVTNDAVRAYDELSTNDAVEANDELNTNDAVDANELLNVYDELKAYDALVACEALVAYDALVDCDDVWA